jgi:restriction system protein
VTICKNAVAEGVLVVRCQECGVEINQPGITPIEERVPCPACGSTRRAISVRAEDTILVSSRVDVVLTPGPSVLVQAVVTLGPKVDEGQIIEAVNVPWYEILKLIEADENAVYRIDPRKWEEMIAGWYKDYGFDEVVLTPRSGDLGRDVIAVKHGVLSIRIIDQVKAYSHGNLVPANDVRAMIGVLSSDLNATKAVVTTTSDFAPKILEDPLITPHIPHRLELVNGLELRKRLNEALKRKKQ